ncbi:hypothetical protein [Saccharicrinis aurantiacus]|uniref:hypothetical protein n=1 Tax=Saccharicrinis aurantiacus TaxID=1849719 RepID=UPI00248F9625|nr:hypothetical protein [Saccharicrinis aurantiacus]
MNGDELAKERTEVSIKNKFILLLMILVYLAMLTQFVPLWDARDSDAALALAIAAIFFDAALLFGIDQKNVLKISYWVSAFCYVSIIIVAEIVDGRFKIAEILSLALITALVSIKYFLVVRLKLKKLNMMQ